MLSEKLQDITTKNAMMVVALATTKLKGIENLWLSPDHHTVNTIYNGTPPGSPARRFVIDWWTAISIDSIFPHVQYFHKEFLKDLDKSIAKHCPISLGHIPLKNGIAAYQDKPTED